MKKIIFIVTVLITCLFISSCSCKKSDLDYKYVGVYLELIDQKEPSISDRNPKLYYNETTKNLIDTNQIYEYQIKSSSITKDIYQDGEMLVYDISCLYSINTSFEVKLEEAKVYPIIYDGKEYRILDKSKLIKINNDETTSVSFNYTYSYENEDYGFKATIKIFKKEV